MVSNIGTKPIVVFFTIILLSQGVPLTYADYVTTTPDGTHISNNDDGSITYRYSDGRVVTEYPPPNETSKVTEVPQSYGPSETTTEFRNGTKLITKAASDPTIWIYPDGTRIELDTLWFTSGLPKTKTITYPNGTEVYFKDNIEQYRFTTVTYPDGTTFKLYGDGTKTTTLPNGVIITERPNGTVNHSYPNGTTFSYYEDGRVFKSNLDGEFTELTQPKYTEQTSMHDPGITILEVASKSAIPKWIKTNAEWWSQGAISDKEFAAGLGFLVKSKIIHVDDVEIDSTGSIDISDDIVIPKWIKTNAEWWSSGVISDSDFKSGIQFMIKEKVIDFTAKNTPLQNRLSSNTYVLDSDLAKSIFQTHKWNEAAMTSLLKLKDFERGDLKDASQKAWNDYGDNKNSEILTKASTLEESAQNAEVQTKQILKSLNKVKEFSKQALNDAKNSGNSVLDLENSVYQAIMIIDDDTKIQNENDYEKVEKNLKKAHNEANDYLQKSIQGILVKDLSSPNTAPNFLFNGVNDIDYSKLSDNTLHHVILPTSDDGFGDTNESTLVAIFGQSDVPLPHSAHILSKILDGELLYGEDGEYVHGGYGNYVTFYDYSDEYVSSGTPDFIARGSTTDGQQVSEVSGLDFLHERIMIGGTGASPDDPPIEPFLDVIPDSSNAPIDDTLSDFFNVSPNDETMKFDATAFDFSPDNFLQTPVDRIIIVPDVDTSSLVDRAMFSSTVTFANPTSTFLSPDVELEFDEWITNKAFNKDPNNLIKIFPSKPFTITLPPISSSSTVEFSSVYSVVNSDEGDIMESHTLTFGGNLDWFVDDPVFRTEIAPNVIDVYSLPGNDPIIHINLDGSTTEIQTTFTIPHEKYKEESNDLFQVGIEFQMSEDIPQEAESLFDEDLIDSYEIYREIRDGKYRPQVDGEYTYTAPQEFYPYDPSDVSPEDSSSDVAPPPGAGQMQQLFPVDTLEIGGLHYPSIQFRVEQAEHCNLNLHYHSHGGPVHSLEGGSYSDPDPNNCGFGLQGGELGFTTYFASSDQITMWEETTGYDIPGVP